MYTMPPGHCAIDQNGVDRPPLKPMQDKETHHNLSPHYLTERGCRGCGAHPIDSYDWMSDLPRHMHPNEWVEVQFKNTRKAIFHNPDNLPLEKEDMVAVEGTPGLDVGRVALVGKLATMRYLATKAEMREAPRRIYRLATEVDLAHYEAAKAREHPTMIESRQIALDLGLDMKIGDVEYQGDGNKAIFYYIAEGRVDFRKLIRVLADRFRIRVEMKQIGARQEAGRIGGIGPCGRPLCCASWMTHFKSVNTTAARFQDLSLNPEKLTGQCAKLKCCTNFEVNCYMEVRRKMPPEEVVLSTEAGDFYFVKSDLLKQVITYSPHKGSFVGAETISITRAKQIIAMNRRGEKPEHILEANSRPAPAPVVDILDDNSLTRFDQKEGDSTRSKRNKRRRDTGDKPAQPSSNSRRRSARPRQEPPTDDSQARNSAPTKEPTRPRTRRKAAPRVSGTSQQPDKE